MEERREDIMERLEKICKDSEVREKLEQRPEAGESSAVRETGVCAIGTKA